MSLPLSTSVSPLVGMPGGLVQDYLPPSVQQPARRGVSFSSILEFAVVCITCVPLSVALGGIITIWTIITLIALTNV